MIVYEYYKNNKKEMKSNEKIIVPKKLTANVRDCSNLIKVLT